MNDEEKIGGMIKTFDEPEPEGMRELDLVYLELDEFEGKKVYKTRFHNKTNYMIEIEFGKEIRRLVVPPKSIRILRATDAKKMYSRYSDVYYKPRGDSYIVDVKIRRGWDDSKVWAWPYVVFHNISGTENIASYVFDSGFQSIQMVKGIPIVMTVDILSKLAEYKRFEITYVDRLEEDDFNKGYLKRVARTEHKMVDKRPKAELDKLKKLRMEMAMEEAKRKLGLEDKV